MADPVVGARRRISILGAHMKDKKNGELFTAEELQALEAEVQKEVDRDLKTKAREDLKRDMLAAARVKRGLAEPSEMIEINLPEHSDRIVVNSVPFMHGREYEVKASLAVQLRETMYRAWQHQAVVEGRQKDFYTRRNTRMHGMTGAASNAPFLKA
jgi:hypothetical protein